LRFAERLDLAQHLALFVNAHADVVQRVLYAVTAQHFTCTAATSQVKQSKQHRITDNSGAVLGTNPECRAPLIPAANKAAVSTSASACHVFRYFIKHQQSACVASSMVNVSPLLR
jgi:hypothetical protein